MTPYTTQPITLKGIPSGILYHYTTIQAFKKIIESQIFLMSHYTNVADNTEIVWAFRIFEEKFGHLFPPKILLKKIIPDQFFIFCTCKRSNNLSLWQNYASNGRGVVIAINAAALYHFYGAAEDKGGNILMSSMDYDNDAFIKLCSDTAQSLRPVALYTPINWQKPLQPADLLKIPGYAEYKKETQPILGKVTLQKNSSFSHEEEVRIVHWPFPHGENYPLEIRQQGTKRKAVLPFSDGGGHLLNSVIITDQGPNIQAINRITERAGLELPVETIFIQDLQ